MKISAGKYLTGSGSMQKINVNIFCDGGVHGNGKEHAVGSFGTLIDMGENRIEISDAFGGVTNNQMEMYGALAGLYYVQFLPTMFPGTNVGKIRVTSDSKYLVDGITKWVPGWKKRGWLTANKEPVKNQELWEHLHYYDSKYVIDWFWVKGHNGHEENERCDELAAGAIKMYKKLEYKKELVLPADLGGSLWHG